MSTSLDSAVDLLPSSFILELSIVSGASPEFELSGVAGGLQSRAWADATGPPPLGWATDWGTVANGISRQEALRSSGLALAMLSEDP